MKCIPAYIYRDHGGDCSNGGLSSKVDNVFVPHPRGWYDAEEDDPKLVKIVKNDYGFGEYVHAEPVAEKPKGHVGYMMGGTFIYSSDSRFREIHPYPIPLHDRTETQELYDSMFD